MKEMNPRALGDDELDAVAGGVVARPISGSKTIDPNQHVCSLYRCNVCGGTRGQHVDCTAGRADRCGSCTNASRYGSEWVCGGERR